MEARDKTNSDGHLCRASQGVLDAVRILYFGQKNGRLTYKSLDLNNDITARSDCLVGGR
jgi:hypothetical protein